MVVLNFDNVLTDDAILAMVFKHLEVEDIVTNVLFVNKRWSRVATGGSQHTPLPPSVVKSLQNELVNGSVSRLKLHCALCKFNLLRDPYFTVNAPRFPINVFEECPWVATKTGVHRKIPIRPTNELPGHVTPDNVGDAYPSWDRRFKDTSKMPCNVIFTASKNLLEWTQVLDLKSALAKRGLVGSTTNMVLNASPKLGFAIHINSRCNVEFSVQMALHKTTPRPLPIYNNANMNAYTRGAIHTYSPPALNGKFEDWFRYACIVGDYPVGVECIVISLQAVNTPKNALSGEGVVLMDPVVVMLNEDMESAWMGQ